MRRFDPATPVREGTSTRDACPERGSSTAERRMHALVRAVGIALLMGAGSVAAQYEPIPGPDSDVYGVTREYRWIYYVPVLTYERRETVFAGPTMLVRSRRFDYETPGLRMERRKLGQYPEFKCKYPDWWVLPNDCGIVWHDAYADFPQITMRREHIDSDVLEWADGEYHVRVNVPRWTWTPKEFRLLVPAFETEPAPPHPWSRAEGGVLAQADRARSTLEADQTATLKTLDQALASLDESIATVEANGGDPSKLASADGATVDLRAVRRSLVEEKTAQSARYARVRTELDQAIGNAPAQTR
jgi:hypothetical protein